MNVEISFHQCPFLALLTSEGSPNVNDTVGADTEMKMEGLQALRANSSNQWMFGKR